MGGQVPCCSCQVATARCTKQHTVAIRWWRPAAPGASGSWQHACRRSNLRQVGGSEFARICAFEVMWVVERHLAKVAG